MKMDIRILENAEKVAGEAAKLIAAMAKREVAARGRFIMAVSGGKTPWLMLKALAYEDLPWENVHVVQVDERVAPAGHHDRNLTHLLESLLPFSSISEDHIHAMPVNSPDLESAAKDYVTTLCNIAGNPPVIDLIHLGLGSDGHTASLVPGDPVLNVKNKDVSITGIYQGTIRMTLTYPIINRSRKILWIITGTEKFDMLSRLMKGDTSIPAGNIRNDVAMVMTDLKSMGQSNLE
jgi:6-phosphogluconolactonase